MLDVTFFLWDETLDSPCSLEKWSTRRLERRGVEEVQDVLTMYSSDRMDASDGGVERYSCSRLATSDSSKILISGLGPENKPLNLVNCVIILDVASTFARSESSEL